MFFSPLQSRIKYFSTRASCCFIVSHGHATLHSSRTSTSASGRLSKPRQQTSSRHHHPPPPSPRPPAAAAQPQRSWRLEGGRRCNYYSYPPHSTTTHTTIRNHYGAGPRQAVVLPPSARAPLLHSNYINVEQVNKSMREEEEGEEKRKEEEEENAEREKERKKDRRRGRRKKRRMKRGRRRERRR